MLRSRKFSFKTGLDLKFTMKNIIFSVILVITVSAVYGELDKHHNYVDMLGIMQKVHEDCPDITYLYNLSSLPSDPAPKLTVNNRSLAVIVFSDNPEVHETCKFGKLCFLN